MAVGDSVVDILTATGNYQPAAGVETCITSLGITGSGDSYRIYDGTNSSPIVPASQGDNNFKNGKSVYIDNTNYLRYIKVTNDGYYCGVIVG